MSFVKGRLSEEEQEILRKKHIPQDPFSHCYEASFFTEVHDKERDIRLVSLGGRGIPGIDVLPEIFAFIWNDELCCIEAYKKKSGTKETGGEVIWILDRIYAPENWKYKKEELIKLITEAFESYGLGGLKWKLNSFRIENITEPKFGGKTGWIYGR